MRRNAQVFFVDRTLLLSTGALIAMLSLPAMSQAQQFAPVGPLTFTKVFEGVNPLPQTVTINSTGGPFAFSASASTNSGGDWLSVSSGMDCTAEGLCDTPHPITVTVNTAVALAQGTYNGQIVVASANNTASMTIPVTITITAPASAFFDNVPGQMSFFMKTDGLSPPAQSVQLRNGGGGTLSWTLAVSTSDGGNWLSASAITGTAPSVVTIALLKHNLPGSGVAAGTFTGKLLFQSAGSSVTVPVSVVVGASTFNQLNGIHFTKVFAGANPLPQILTISSSGNNFSYITTKSTARGGDWLTVSAGAGCTGGGLCNTPHAIIATVNPGITLAAGTYTGQIVVATGSMAMTVPVTLTIVPAGTGVFDNVPGQMSFFLKTNGLAPPAQSIEIRNGASGGFLDWTLTAATSDGGNWLTFSRSAGTAPSLITVGISVPNLPNMGLVAGTFTGHLLFQSASSRVSVPVSVVVGEDVFNQLNAISFTKPFGGANPLPQTLNIASTGANFAFFATSSSGAGGNWLSVAIGSACTGSEGCNTPRTITATVNAPPTLPGGSYTGQIVVMSSNGSMTMTIPVSLTVSPPDVPFFDNLPGQMSFSFKTAGPAPPAQTLQIRNAGSGTLIWSLTAVTSDGGNWLSASALTGTAPSSVTITLLKANLPGAGLMAGTFNGHLLFQRPGGGSITVPVSATVGSDVFQQLNAISFTKAAGDANPLPQILTIASTGANFEFVTAGSTATGGDWLDVSIGSGCLDAGACNTSHVVTATVNPSVNLGAGTYTGQIVFTSTTSAGSMTVPVTLTVAPASASFFDNVPGHISFSFGLVAGNPPNQTVHIRNAGAGTLNWTVSASTSDGRNWLNASPSSGTAPATLTIGIIAANLPGQGLVGGIFTGLLVLNSAGGAVSIPVTAVVGNPRFVQLSPLTFTKSFGGPNPLGQTLSVTSSGGGISFLTAASGDKGGDWLSVALGGGCTGGGTCSTPHTSTVNINASPTLAPGTYTGQIVMTGTTMAMTVPVTLTVERQTPAVIAATGGTPQSTTVNTAFGAVLQATVRDANNLPVGGITVTFSAPGVGATGTFAGGVNTAVTSAQGVATSAIFTANAVSGTYIVTATAEGVPNPASFTLTNTPVVTTCVTNVTPIGITVPPSQTRSTLAVTTTPGCNWTASSSASWLEIFPLTGTNSAAISWTAYPNFGTSARTATVTVDKRTFTVTQSASSETQMQRFVRLLYFSYLGRSASITEVNGQVNSGATRAQLAMNFLNSTEFNLGGRFAAGLYLGIIDRDAEFGGWQFQRQVLARGEFNHDQLVSNFLNSQEFNLKFGVLTNTAFVRLMYQNILLRSASQQEVDAWLNVLSNPANTRTIVARSFLNSPEFQKGTGPRLLAFLLYATLLLRDATPDERAALTAQLANPAHLQTAIETLANSQEINGLLQ
jgi:hypothetical protein